MRPLTLKIAVLTVLCAGPRALAAGEDWAYLRSIRVAEPGHFEASLGLKHSVQESWALGDHFAYMQESPGAYRMQRLVDAQLDLGWQATNAWGLKLSIPYVFAEFSQYVIGVQNFYLNDATLHRTDSIGDIRLELRRAWGVEPGIAGASAGAWLGIVGPSGVGPFEASQTMAATGEGRWQFEPGFVLSASSGTWTLAAQAGAPIQVGRQSTLSSAAALSYGKDGPNVPVGGHVWLGPRFGVEGSVGLAWQWYNAEDSRHTLAVELQGWQRSPLDQGGVLTPDTEQAGLRFIPQLQSDFGRFRALAAWDLPFLYANNEASSDYGGAHFRVDYGF